MTDTATKQIKIGVLGATGRVGSLLTQELEAAGNYAGGSHEDSSADVIDALFDAADVLIDFTRPEGTENHAALAAKYGKALVIGTTGLSDEQEKLLSEAAQKSAIVYAANMSIGVNMLIALVEKAAARLGTEWDIEISETHHKHKVDSPSGTALALGKAAASGRKKNLDPVTDRNGARKEGDIGFAIQRGGDVVGEHMVTFFAEGERIEPGHKATTRALFAKGAIRAAHWVSTRPPGLYSMHDVLGL